MNKDYEIRNKYLDMGILTLNDQLFDTKAIIATLL